MKSVSRIVSAILAVVLWGVLIWFVGYQKHQRDNLPAPSTQPTLVESTDSTATTLVAEQQLAPHLAKAEKPVTTKSSVTTTATTTTATSTVAAESYPTFVHHPTRVDDEWEPLPSNHDSYSEPETTIPDDFPQTTVPDDFPQTTVPGQPTQTTVPTGDISQAYDPSAPMTTVIQTTVSIADHSK